MWFGIITLFPEMFSALAHGITGRVLKKNLLQLEYWNPRDFSDNRRIDDISYGGGPGMVMQVQPMLDAINAAKIHSKNKNLKTVYLSPRGKLFHQDLARKTLQETDAMILVAGRYEGLDERIYQLAQGEEWSIGDYILSGGELAAMTLIDVFARLLPGALGDPASVKEESHGNGLLEYPHYTRPQTIKGLQVPKVLCSGNHAAISTWRLKASLGCTFERRPDLLKKKALSHNELKLLDEYLAEKTRLNK